jgi:hypothetical protein
MSPEAFEKIYELDDSVEEKGDEWAKAAVLVASALNDVLTLLDEKKKHWESALRNWLKEDGKSGKGGGKCEKPSGETGEK